MKRGRTLRYPQVRSRHGALMLEILIAVLLSLLIGAALATMLLTIFRSSSFLTGQNNVESEARNQVATLADQLRNAQSYSPSGSKEVLSAAAASDVTIFTDSAGDTTRFWLDTTTTPATLKKSVTISGGTTTSVLLTGVTSLQFTYYQQASKSYTAAAGGWTTTASSHAPTSLERPYVGAMAIAVTVTSGAYTDSINSFVRLRNSPYP